MFRVGRSVSAPFAVRPDEARESSKPKSDVDRPEPRWYDTPPSIRLSPLSVYPARDCAESCRVALTTGAS